MDDRIPDAGTPGLPWNDLAGGSVCRRRPSQPGQPGLRVGGLGSPLPDIATCPLSSDLVRKQDHSLCLCKFFSVYALPPRIMAFCKTL